MWRDDSADSTKPNSEINPLYRWDVRHLLEYKEVEVNRWVVEIEIPPVLIHLGCYNTVPEAGCLRKSRILFLTVWEAGKSKTNILADSVSGKNLLLPWWPSSLCVFTLWKRQKSFHWWLFFQVLFLNFWPRSATCRTSPTTDQTHATAVGARSHNAGQTGKSTGGFYKITYFIQEGSTLITSSSPSDPPPNTITLGTRFQHLNFRGHRHMDHSTSTSLRLQFPWSWLLKW